MLHLADADGADFVLESLGVVPRTEHLAEAFREAGYATFHTLSDMFSGKNSNLHQGVEVLNLCNVADRHPDVVADLRLQLEQWRETTEARKVRPDGEGADVRPEEPEQLGALGYENRIDPWSSPDVRQSAGLR